MDKQEKNTKKTSNPYSTGGGGANFESKVGAYFITKLLCKGRIQGFSEFGHPAQIDFQTQWTGMDVDDLILHGSTQIKTGNQQQIELTYPKFVLQVKSRLNFTESDLEFEKVIQECWQTFNHTKFSKKYDRIGIVIGKSIQKVRDLTGNL